MHLVPSVNDPLGYVVLHGDTASLSSDTDALEVVVADDGKPFPTYMEALVFAKVSCSLEWRVVAVRTAERASRLAPENFEHRNAG